MINPKMTPQLRNIPPPHPVKTRIHFHNPTDLFCLWDLKSLTIHEYCILFNCLLICKIFDYPSRPHFRFSFYCYSLSAVDNLFLSNSCCVIQAVNFISNIIYSSHLRLGIFWYFSSSVYTISQCWDAELGLFLIPIK